MLTTVKIGKAEQQAMKALAKSRGQFLSFLLNEAIRQYLANNQSQSFGQGA